MGLFSKSASQQSPRAKVLSFINQKGGVGKTTMAFNVACALGDKGHKVLCIDMDPQSNLSLLFNYDASESESDHIFHLLINSVRELKALHTPILPSEVIVKGEKIDLLPAGQELSGFELTVAGISAPRQLILKKFLQKSGLLDHYDYVVIDGPPTLGLLVVNILCATDGVMVPFRPDEFSRKGLAHFSQVLEDIEEMEVTQIPEVLAYIPNLVDIRRKQEENDLERIGSHIEQSRAKVVNPFFNRAQLVKAQAGKKSVFDYQSKEYIPLQEQFRELVNLIEDWNS